MIPDFTAMQRPVSVMLVSCCFYQHFRLNGIRHAAVRAVTDIYAHDKNWHNGIN